MFSRDIAFSNDLDSPSSSHGTFFGGRMGVSFRFIDLDDVPKEFEF